MALDTALRSQFRNICSLHSQTDMVKCIMSKFVQKSPLCLRRHVGYPILRIDTQLPFRKKGEEQEIS